MSFREAMIKATSEDVARAAARLAAVRNAQAVLAELRRAGLVLKVIDDELRVAAPIHLPLKTLDDYDALISRYRGDLMALVALGPEEDPPADRRGRDDADFTLPEKRR